MIIAVLFVVIRILAPPIILQKINNYLAVFSENYEGHIDDFGLSLWRGAYRLEKLSLKTKASPVKTFATAADVDVSVAWRELFSGRILTDVVVTNLNFIADAMTAKPAKEDPKKSVGEASDAGKKLFPVEIERIELRDSRLEYSDLHVFVDQIEGRLSHVSGSEQNPISLMTFRGFFQGKSALKVVGDIDMIHKPVDWVISAELQRFNLAEASSLITRYVPLTFKKGNLDLYTEVKSEKSRISGYLKPFVKDAEVIGDDKDFKSIKHFGVEITVAFLNLFFRSSRDHILATKVLFKYENKKFDWNINEVLSELFKNGYREPLPRGVENVLTLKTKETTERKIK